MDKKLEIRLLGGGGGGVGGRGRRGEVELRHPLGELQIFRTGVLTCMSFPKHLQDLQSLLIPQPQSNKALHLRGEEKLQAAKTLLKP